VTERQRDPEVAKKPAYISYCRRFGAARPGVARHGQAGMGRARHGSAW